jgi:hypothetical protein
LAATGIATTTGNWNRELLAPEQAISVIGSGNLKRQIREGGASSGRWSTPWLAESVTPRPAE